MNPSAHFQLKKNQKQLTRFMTMCRYQVYLSKLLRAHKQKKITLSDYQKIANCLKRVQKAMTELCHISNINLPLSCKTFPLAA